MVIAKVAKSMGGDLPSSDDGYQLIFEHIDGLVRSGRLMAQGDIKLWRFSEVRRADGTANQRPETS